MSRGNMKKDLLYFFIVFLLTVLNQHVCLSGIDGLNLYCNMYKSSWNELKFWLVRFPLCFLDTSARHRLYYIRPPDRQIPYFIITYHLTWFYWRALPLTVGSSSCWRHCVLVLLHGDVEADAHVSLLLTAETGNSCRSVYVHPMAINHGLFSPIAAVTPGRLSADVRHGYGHGPDEQAGDIRVCDLIQANETLRLPFLAFFVYCRRRPHHWSTRPATHTSSSSAHPLIHQSIRQSPLRAVDKLHHRTSFLIYFLPPMNTTVHSEPESTGT